MKAFLGIVLCTLFTVSLGDEEGTTDARLLVAKQIQNKYLVEGMDVVIRYNLFNVGDQPAVNVALVETGFGADDFDVVSGQTNVKIDRIPPHGNNSHTVVVRPKKYGYFNFTSAEVRYQNGDEPEAPVQTGLSSEPGQGLIIALKDYERQFSSHMLDWGAFAIMTLPSLGVPFMLWWSSKTKYESLSRSKRD